MRQLLFTGFNGFGQHNRSNVDRISGRVAALTEIDVPFDGANVFIVAPSWRYTAIAVGKSLWLRGLLEATPGECLCVDAPMAIKALAACDTHCLVLLENGELYQLRAKLNAILMPIKLERPPDISVPKKRNVFGSVKPAEDVSNAITDIACGSYINVAISSTNTVYSIPLSIHRFVDRQWRVQQLECGHEHALLLNGNGDVYTWGNGLRGQLGHALLRVEEKPLLMEALAGVKITRIAAGGWHSAAISSFGDLYVWGLNCNGQLGMRVMKPDGLLKEPTVYPLPQVVDLPTCCGTDAESESCEPLLVFAGSRHTLLIRKCGRLWGSGWCAHGQLGKQPAKLTYVDTFQPVQDAPRGTNYTVVCGPWSSLIVKSTV